MKLNNIILVSLLLAILTLGAVSASQDVNMTASDNVQDSNLAVEDNEIVADNPSDDVIGDDEEGNNITEFNIVFPETVKAMEWAELTVYAPNETSGELNIYLDGDEDYGYRPIDGGGITNWGFQFNSFGKHTIKAKFISDNDVCKNATFSKTYNIDDFEPSISLFVDDHIVYGMSTQLEVNFPEEVTGKFVVFINGNNMGKYSIFDDIYINVPALLTRASQLNVSVQYKGNSKFKAKTFNQTFDVMPYIKAPGYVSYDDNLTVSIDYYEGAVIHFSVYEDYVDLIAERNVTCPGGKFDFDIADGFDMDGRYELFASPSPWEYEHDFSIIPKLSISQQIWINDIGNVTIEFPADYKGKTLNVTLDDNVLFEGQLGDDCKVSVQLPDLKAGDHSFNFRFVEIGDYPYWDYYFNVMEESPSLDLGIEIPDKLVVSNDYAIAKRNVEDATGDFFVYVDGVLKALGSYSQDFEFSTRNMALGNHTISIFYEGDDYFKPVEYNKTFEVVEHIVTVPKTIVRNGGEYAYLSIPSDAKGTLRYYIDGRKIDDVIYFDSDSWIGDDGCHIYINLGECSLYKNHTIKLVYSGDGKYSKFIESYNFYMDYTVWFDFGEEAYNFGSENQVTIKLPVDLESNYEVLIDGVQFKKHILSDDESAVIVDISEFVGTHEIAFDFKGNKLYNPLKVNDTFTVNDAIKYSEDNVYKYDGSVVWLLLPKDAAGNLIVEIDGEYYGAAPMVNGYAEVCLSNLAVGSYNLKAYYDGTDYEIDNVSGEIRVACQIVVDSYELFYGDTLYVRLTLPENSTDTLNVRIGGITKQASLENGSAVIPITGLGVGMHDLNAEYWVDDEQVYELEEEVTVVPKLSISDNMVVFGKNMVTFTANKDFDGEMEIDVDDDTYVVPFKNGKASLSLSKLTSGKHIIRPYFDDGYASHNYGEIAVNVKKAANPKLTLTPLSIYYMNGAFKATVIGINGKVLRGANVVFKVNGKTVKTVKTNAAGIAAFKMTNLPNAYKLTAQYGKVAVTKKVTVKRVLALKSLTVKKSAKNVVLQATLKKGKTPIRGQWVVFKFAGKKFKAITNKAGLAKFVVKKAVFSKLKVGKNVAYQVTYVKDTIKKVTTVKK